MTGAVAHRPRVGLLQVRELRLATHEGGVETAWDSRRVLTNTEQPVGDERFRLPLGVERWHRLELDRVCGQLPRPLADQDLARLCRLLEPRRNIDGVAGCKRAADARDDLARVDADSHRELDAEPLVQLAVQGRES